MQLPGGGSLLLSLVHRLSTLWVFVSDSGVQPKAPALDNLGTILIIRIWRLSLGVEKAVEHGFLHLLMWNWVARVRSVMAGCVQSATVEVTRQGKWFGVEMTLLPPDPTPASVISVKRSPQNLQCLHSSVSFHVSDRCIRRLSYTFGGTLWRLWETQSFNREVWFHMVSCGIVSHQ